MLRMAHTVLWYGRLDIESWHNDRSLEAFLKCGSTQEWTIGKECEFFTGTPYLGQGFAQQKEPFALLIERRGIGRKKIMWLRNIKRWTGIRNTKVVIHITRHRKTWSHQTSMNSSEKR